MGQQVCGASEDKTLAKATEYIQFIVFIADKLAL
jgi:hypothetical protein